MHISWSCNQISTNGPLTIFHSQYKQQNGLSPTKCQSPLLIKITAAHIQSPNILTVTACTATVPLICTMKNSK